MDYEVAEMGVGGESVVRTLIEMVVVEGVLVVEMRVGVWMV